jgi:hypothetical protein
MRIEEGLHVVMSGAAGFDLTDALDRNGFLIDGVNFTRNLSSGTMPSE